nr:MAG TPA: hypothetical protein [Caudoviricetes sp.]
MLYYLSRKTQYKIVQNSEIKLCSFNNRIFLNLPIIFLRQNKKASPSPPF